MPLIPYTSYVVNRVPNVLNRTETNATKTFIFLINFYVVGVMLYNNRFQSIHNHLILQSFTKLISFIHFRDTSNSSFSVQLFVGEVQMEH